MSVKLRNKLSFALLNQKFDELFIFSRQFWFYLHCLPCTLQRVWLKNICNILLNLHYIILSLVLCYCASHSNGFKNAKILVLYMIWFEVHTSKSLVKGNLVTKRISAKATFSCHKHPISSFVSCQMANIYVVKCTKRT